ncbi:cyclic pyranopterin monophosphate synthase MoaC [Acidithiobacillus sp. CV18-2]|uniref:Cyclic pyranopterin monophosphate synthase n=1 Tax=Igneacidithiobacillus copahuensis TaxID=2724909 RepID=A0AAE2YQP8_9PROT|nr:cyclic pyranopterin monophosphate synthase MoaC [Igneacidithiobacillus copahuensis]MBU2754690.1 cyclic pyranopterin monophosphate synthase MoaC [Acidithiobacillus sp. CV18-3]MBU2756828.1 cyclic pyranopterin monophosphate synthase MoaC [Acidithiobacillus sp. BN09-2]MBU2778496.1 cyclic pyranopterin monophosphate synthase MoaC [Acidithiobacillus sp. CV18-2]MBU2795302.1 cyclic pyranopterin monophosphate synthase MoaC [Acidithiobacillus sp. VAN18-2]MBU2798089.1 cyclic pyranopterin monophosphate 
MQEKSLTHFTQQGEAQMVEVGAKPVTLRRALAGGAIRMAPATLARIRAGDMHKGDVLAVARIAAIQASKRTAELIPLAHPLFLTGVEIRFALDADSSEVRCEAEARCQGQTGVEMEALTAVSVALLTIYDMCKAIDRGMTLTGICLLRKEGGKSGVWERKPGAGQ